MRLLESERKKADPFYSASNVKRLKESSQQEKDGKMVSKTLEGMEAMEKGTIDEKDQESGRYLDG